MKFHFFSYLCANLFEAMRIQKLKILYYLIFVIYLTSINVQFFFHHHQEGHDEGGNLLHSHLIDHSSDSEDTNHIEFHSAENNYFDENHIFNTTSFIFSNAIIIVSAQTILANDQEQNSFAVLTTQSDCIISRDKYVLTEANLPPPIS